MAFQMTAKQFFEGTVAKGITGAGPLKQVGGVIEFDIEGQNGGSWVVDLDQGRVATKGGTPQVIVHATDRDFMALVEGRMSVSDGLVTERLRVSGEAGKLVRLFEALETMRPA